MARRARAARGLLGAGLLFTAASCGADEPRFKDVLLITVDTLRADHLELYGYERDTMPNLSRRFEDGIVYLRSIAAEASTSPSVVSILSGQLPQDHGVRMFYQVLPAETRLLVDMLPPDYQKAAFVSNIVLTDEALGIADRFDHYDDYVDEREPLRPVYERNARRTSEAVEKWLAEGLDPRRPVFLWVHYIDPHGPYKPPADNRHVFESEFPVPIQNGRVPAYTRVEGVSDGRYYVDRYDEEIAYTDEQIERVFAAYERRRPIADALLVFSADHGESMMEHEKWFTHSYHAYQEIVHVPLLVRGPGVERARVGRLTSGIDIAPTILGFVGVGVPDTMPAVDLRRPVTLRADRAVFTEAAQPQRQIRAMLRGDDKWMALLSVEDGHMVGGLEYDLDQDPAELHPRPRPPKGLPQDFLDRIAADPDPGGVPSDMIAGRQRSGPKVNLQNLSDEDRKAMEALGYIESGEEETTAPPAGHDHE